MDYLMGTLRSHDQEHHECTEHFLCWQHSKEIGLDILNVFMMYQVGHCQAHFPFPYNVFTMSRAGKLGFVPSVSGPGNFDQYMPRVCYATKDAPTQHG